MIKDIFKQFYAKHKNVLDKEGIKLSGIEEPVTMSIEGKLEDGTIVASTADAFVEGAPIFIVDAEGATTPAPDGEHTLEDGTVITVADGMITTVVAVEVEEAEMSAEDIEKNLNEMAEKLSAITSENETLKAKITELEGTKAELSKVKAEFAALKKSPAAPSVKEVKQSVTTEKKQTEKAWSAMTYLERIQNSRQKQSNN
jgi:hypothetical protein